MSPWLVYLWTRADSVVNASIGFAILSGVTGALCGLCCLMTGFEDYDNEHTALKKVFKWLITIFIILTSIAVLTPTKKDIAMIYVIPKMANSQTFKELSDSTPEITKLALEALKETLQGMTKEEVTNGTTK